MNWPGFSLSEAQALTKGLENVITKSASSYQRNIILDIRDSHF